MPFQIHALPAEDFAPLFALSDTALATARARRMVVDASPGYPCRVSLADAELGETVILVNYTHLPADSPYRSAHAVFVREGASQAQVPPGTVPEMLRRRLVAVRAFDAADDMRAADIVAGEELGEAIEQAFEDPAVAYLHLHNAARGCYLARATRAAAVTG